MFIVVRMDYSRVSVEEWGFVGKLMFKFKLEEIVAWIRENEVFLRCNLEGFVYGLNIKE